MTGSSKPAAFQIGDRVQHKRHKWAGAIESLYVHSNGSKGYNVRRYDGVVVFVWQVDCRAVEERPQSVLESEAKRNSGQAGNSAESPSGAATDGEAVVRLAAPSVVSLPAAFRRAGGAS